MTTLAHIGTKCHSGRYPPGSGEHPVHCTPILTRINELKANGLTEVEIATALGMSTTELRQQKRIAKAREKQDQKALVERLKAKGMSNTAIAKRIGRNEQYVRRLLAPSISAKLERHNAAVDTLKKNVEDRKYIDVGLGSEGYLGLTSTEFKAAIRDLENQNYTIHTIFVEQLGTGAKTRIKVLAAPDTPYSEVFANRDSISAIGIQPLKTKANDLGLEPITNLALDRLDIVYGPDGGNDRDGLIELRPTKDLILGNANYAQVRIGVEGDRYLKGMAVFSDNLPKGVDVRFHTNKTDTGNKLDALKQQDLSSDNPFGSTIIQQAFYENGERRISPVNIVGSSKPMIEGAWNSWSKSLSSQMLSKQSPKLIKAQLERAYLKSVTEKDDISQLTNPTVKKYMLEKFADTADAAAVDLKAAAMPRQSTAVILPVPSLKTTEVYAPNYRNGEKVALIRHPHGGIFEIPILTVNNKNPEAISMLGKNAKDAVGIHPTTAAILSGADYDGDTVLVIPNTAGHIKNSPALKSLITFNPKAAYPYREGMPIMTERGKQKAMGDISNLITDMTIKGATISEISRAVKHSMVVIDAEKHKLDYTQSKRDFGIADLKRKYQGGSRKGASTLISKASGEKRVPERTDYTKIDKDGNVVYNYTNRSYVDKNGKKRLYLTKSTNMAEVKDARQLSSGTFVEALYANYANRMKDLARQARKESLGIKHIPYSPEARQTYSKEVASLKAKLRLAIRNKPRERQAQILANSIMKERIRIIKETYNRKPTAKETSRIRGQALATARTRFKAVKPKIIISPREWEAIQMGAITSNRLKDILANADKDRVRELAMPTTRNVISSAKVTRAKSMRDFGYTNAEIADALGISTTAVSDIFAN